jgi:hypothetical protein
MRLLNNNILSNVSYPVRSFGVPTKVRVAQIEEP